jgi:hypothetical protein
MSLNWDLDPAPPASSSPSLTTPTGKFASLSFEAGGGSLGGGAEIILLEYADCVQGGGAICSYLKGKDQRTVCTSINCKMMTHKSAGEEKRFDFGLDKASVLVIKTGPAVALRTPTLQPLKLGESLDRYLNERRSVDAWVALFEQTNKHSLTEEEVDHVAENLEKNTESRALFTPWKRRKLDQVVAPSPSESLASFQDVTFVEPLDDLGDSPTMVISNLTLAWPELVRNMTTVHEMAAAAKRGNKDLAVIFEEEMQAAGGQLLMVLSKLGDRPTKLNGASAFEAIGALDDEVIGVTKDLKELDALMRRLLNQVSVTTVEMQDIKGELAKNHGGGATTADVNFMRSDVLTQVRGAIEPFIQLVGRLSASKEDPGGLIVSRVIDLEREVVELRASKADVGARGAAMPQPLTQTTSQATGNLDWSLTGPTFAGPSPGSGSGPSEREQKLHQSIVTLERRVGELENQFGGDVVVLAGTEFKSVQDAGAWLKLQAPGDGDYAYFLDAHGLMTLAYGRGSTTAEVLKMEEYKEKLKYASSDAALIAAGFQIAIPEFFGIKTADLSAKSLPGLSKGTDWDAKNGDRGLRYDISRKCMAVYMDRNKTMSYSLNPSANLVASTMLTEAQEFVTMLIVWINTFLTDRANKGDDEAETLQHMSHAVRTICEMLHAARAPGRGPYPPGEKGARIFWGTLQALTVMRKLREANFSSHPALSHILNLHLQDNSVSKADMAGMEKKLKAVLDEVKALKSAADRGVSAKKKGNAGATGASTPT